MYMKVQKGSQSIPLPTEIPSFSFHYIVSYDVEVAESYHQDLPEHQPCFMERSASISLSVKCPAALFLSTDIVSDRQLVLF